MYCPKNIHLIVTVEENQFKRMIWADGFCIFLHKNVWQESASYSGYSDYFVGHATMNEQREEAGINADSIVKSIIDRMN